MTTKKDRESAKNKASATGNLLSMFMPSLAHQLFMPISMFPFAVTNDEKHEKKN